MFKDNTDEEFEKALRLLAGLVKDLTPFFEELMANLGNDVTPDEINDLFSDLFDHLPPSVYSLGSQMYHRAVCYYYSVKEAAANGDQNAKNNLEELRPKFHQSLLSNCEKN
ncbi:MAG: hypothetical protein NTW49_04880 [Bacteroidia bacterium]|nr:hypothetical protein [Bacteroidia bacterium]